MTNAPWVSKINPWIAQPLTEATKDAKLRQILSVDAERVIYGRQAIITGWAGLGLGAAMLGASIFGWVMLFPLKTVQHELWIGEASTGIITKPLSLEDAPKHFGAAFEEHAIDTYISARERWVPELDRENDHIAKIMSSPEEQARINASRTKVDSNSVSVGAGGQVEIENLHFFPQAMDKDSQTRRYLVRFTRTVWHGSNPDPSEPWTAVVDFQFHPERSMIPADRVKNPGGFVAVAYTADSDNRNKRRQ